MDAEFSRRSALHEFPPAKLRFSQPVNSTDASQGSFDQRYFVWDKSWVPHGPVLFYTGGQGAIDKYYDRTGLLFEIAPAVNGMVVFAEHRYFGESRPRAGSEDLRGLTIEAAVEDFRALLLHLRQERKCSDTGCPVILFGGSYGGMLTAWLRRKYPELSAGAVASSAPTDFFPGKNDAFWAATLSAYEKYGGQGCHAVAGAARRAVESATEAELRTLRACAPGGDAPSRDQVMSYFLGALATLPTLDYSEAEVGAKGKVTLPAFPMREACAAAPGKDAGRPELFAWVDKAASILVHYRDQAKCHDVEPELVGGQASSAEGKPRSFLGLRRSHRAELKANMGNTEWQYLACTELPMQPLTTSGFGFFPPLPEQLPKLGEACMQRFGVAPREGGLPRSPSALDADFSTTSKVVWTFGEKDPWRAGQPRRLDPSSSYIEIPGAAHHEDLLFRGEGEAPEVQAAKQKILALVKKWISDSAYSARQEAGVSVSVKVSVSTTTAPSSK